MSISSKATMGRSSTRYTPSRYDTVELGDAESILTGQHELLRTVVKVLRNKRKLDERYADDLEQLLHPLEVISTKISIEGLVRPILSLFTGEIELRRKTHQELGKLIDSVALPSKHLDASRESGSDLIEELSKANENHARCFDAAKEAMPKLQSWFGRVNSKIAADDVIARMSDFKMPPEEVAYRRAVTRQHATSSRLLDWYKEGLPSLLDAHSQRLEQVFGLVRSVSGEYLSLATNLAASISTSLQGMTEFSPTDAVGICHFVAEKESMNSSLQQVAYHNYMTNGAAGSLFLGNRLLANSLLRNRLSGLKMLGSMSPIEYPSREKTAQVLKTCFEIESEGFEEFNYRDVLALHGKETLLVLTYLEFSNMEPLFPLSEETSRLYSKGLPRKHMTRIWQEVNEAMKRSAVQIEMNVFRDLFVKYDPSDACELLTGDRDSKLIILDVSRKWDFDKGAPFPTGIVREGTAGSAIIKLF